MNGTMVSLLMVWLISACVCGLAAQTERPPAKPYRVIFNCDGGAVFWDANGDMNQWIRNIFAGLENNSHVDALFWCGGVGNVANYDSSVLELMGERIGRTSPFLLRLIEEGNDPPNVVVAEARRRGLDVFYSFRVNAIHDAWDSENSAGFPTFKQEHPEWMIGKGYPHCMWTALNFAIPEVRELKFQVVEEIFQKYDFDGLELDFMRGPPFFIPGEEPRNAPILTEWLRRVRQHLNQRGQERGRPIELAVRVDESLEACRLDGFEVETWLKERLVDILILASGTIDIEVEQFKQLAEGPGVLISPCLYGWPRQYKPIPAELVRGLALNYWHQGADGLYTFNWFPHSTEEGGERFDAAYQVPLLKEIGDPATLRSKPMMFAADRGSPGDAYPHNWLHCVLPAELTEGQTVEVPILVGEDLAAAAQQHPLSRLELRVECSNLATRDSLAIALNGEGLLWQNRANRAITVALTPEQIRHGRNYVSLRVAKRAPQAEGVVAVTAVELHVDYE